MPKELTQEYLREVRMKIWITIKDLFSWEFEDDYDGGWQMKHDGMFPLILAGMTLFIFGIGVAIGVIL